MTRWLTHFDFSTAVPNLGKLDRKQEPNVLYEGSAFRTKRKTKMATVAFDLLRHFRLLFWNLYRIWQTRWEVKTQFSFFSCLCFRPIWKTENIALASYWLRYFRLHLWHCWMECQKIARKQEHDFLYQVRVFLAELKTDMADLTFDWLIHLWRLICNN